MKLDKQHGFRTNSFVNMKFYTRMLAIQTNHTRIDYWLHEILYNLGIIMLTLSAKLTFFYKLAFFYKLTFFYKPVWKMLLLSLANWTGQEGKCASVHTPVKLHLWIHHMSQDTQSNHAAAGGRTTAKINGNVEHNSLITLKLCYV